MHARSCVLALAVTVVVWSTALTIFAPLAHAQLRLYDNFSAPKIPRERWIGINPGSPGSMEAVREIRGRRLFLSHRVIGGTGSDTGQTTSDNMLQFVPSAAIGLTEVRVDVQVVSSAAFACAANPRPTIAAARFRGDFFNDGGSTGADDRTGNVQAQVGASRLGDSADAANILKVGGALRRCTNAACKGPIELGSIDIGHVRKGVRVTLTMRWDKTNHGFWFQMNDELPQWLGYSVSDAAPPVAPIAGLETFGTVANCTTLPRTSAEIAAYFDNVFVGP